MSSFISDGFFQQSCNLFHNVLKIPHLLTGLGRAARGQGVETHRD